MNKNIQPILTANALAILAGYYATQHLEHTTVKGAAREALFRAAIEPWFGPSVHVGSGHVVNSVAGEGSHPPQCDLVVYYPDVQPPVFLGGPSAPAYFPVEGVAAIIEVKSNLQGGTALDDALTHLSGFDPALSKYLSGMPMDQEGHRPSAQTKHPLRIVFAFATGIKTKETAESHLKSNNSWDMACLLGLGTWLRLSNGNMAELISPDSSKDPNELSAKAEQLVLMSAVLSENIKNIRSTRGNPGLQRYVMADVNSALRKVE